MHSVDISDLDAPVNANPDQVTHTVNSVTVQRVELLRDRRQPALGGQRVPVTHSPQTAVLVAERCAQIVQAVDLTILRLTELTSHRHKIVAVHGGGTTAIAQAGP